MNKLLPNLGMSSTFLIRAISFAKIAHIAYFIYLWSHLFHMLWLMCFQVYFKPSHRCIEREIGVFGEDKGFHSVTHPSPSLRATLHLWRREPKGLRLWYNLHSYVLFAKLDKVVKRALMTPFLAIHAKGGESISPKQKDRTTTPISKIFETSLSFYMFFNWYLWN